MPICQTKFHGALTYAPEQVLHIPSGLFGFTQETEFLLLELPSARPIAFLQSIRSSNLCFISLPAQVIEGEYRCSMGGLDLQAFGYSESAPPVMGKDVLCLVLLTVGERQAITANLLAPIVIDIARHQGRQVIVNAPYSHRHPVFTPELRRRADQ